MTTLIYELDLNFLKMYQYLLTKMNFIRQGFQLERYRQTAAGTDRQTDRQTAAGTDRQTDTCDRTHYHAALLAGDNDLVFVHVVLFKESKYLMHTTFLMLLVVTMVGAELF